MLFRSREFLSTKPKLKSGSFTKHIREESDTLVSTSILLPLKKKKKKEIKVMERED